MLKIYWKVFGILLTLVILFHPTPTLAMDPPQAPAPSAFSLFPSLKIKQKDLEKMRAAFTDPKKFLDEIHTDSDSDWGSHFSSSVSSDYSSDSDSSDYESDYLPKEAFENEIQKINFFICYVTGITGKPNANWPIVYKWLVSQKSDAAITYWLEHLVSEQSSQNPEKLINWYKKRAEAMDPIAHRKLGNSYKTGIKYKDNITLPKDHKKATEHYTKAAEHGDPIGYRKLGYLYQHGVFDKDFDAPMLLEGDRDQAINFLTRAAEQGDWESYESLGSLYEEDSNLPEEKLATECYTKAIKLKNTSANEVCHYYNYPKKFLYRYENYDNNLKLKTLLKFEEKKGNMKSSVIRFYFNLLGDDDFQDNKEKWPAISQWLTS